MARFIVFMSLGQHLKGRWQYVKLYFFGMLPIQNHLTDFNELNTKKYKFVCISCIVRRRVPVSGIIFVIFISLVFLAMNK